MEPSPQSAEPGPETVEPGPEIVEPITEPVPGQLPKVAQTVEDPVGVRGFGAPCLEKWLGFGVLKLGFEDLAAGAARESSRRGVGER